MNSGKYIKSLAYYEGRKGKLLYWVLLCMPFFWLIMGCLNLWLASRIGEASQYNLGDFAQILFEEIDVTRQYEYSGVFLAGVSRFNTALLQLGCAVALSPLAWGVVFMRKRNQVILEVLRKHGEA